jgi:4-diphosphocytidyl-2-C-methyl-D-erythritol kinase
MPTEFAPAKINLALHVTGRRADGYHLLDSLVVFADVGDRVEATHAPHLSLAITGPQAASLAVTDDNLVLRAARAMGATAALILHKVLPVASGIGGGSADAAATLRLLARMTGRPLPGAEATLALGADVPVCLAGSSLRMRGVGEVITPFAAPKVWAVLANPGVAVPTPDVFRALTRRQNPPLPPVLPALTTAAGLAAFLADQRNDLEAAAIALAPAIATCMAALAAQPGCLLTRMSGSGATCFGLFSDEHQTKVAAHTLQSAHPNWWITPTRLG